MYNNTYGTIYLYNFLKCWYEDVCINTVELGNVQKCNEMLFFGTKDRSLDSWWRFWTVVIWCWEQYVGFGIWPEIQAVQLLSSSETSEQLVRLLRSIHRQTEFIIAWKGGCKKLSFTSVEGSNSGKENTNINWVVGIQVLDLSIQNSKLLCKEEEKEILKHLTL